MARLDSLGGNGGGGGGTGLRPGAGVQMSGGSITMMSGAGVQMSGGSASMMGGAARAGSGELAYGQQRGLLDAGAVRSGSRGVSLDLPHQQPPPQRGGRGSLDLQQLNERGGAGGGRVLASSTLLGGAGGTGRQYGEARRGSIDVTLPPIAGATGSPTSRTK